jgi:(2Fe-2S) ferredoxin
MENPAFPFKSIIFVCTNTRGEDGRVACANPGRCGAKVRDMLKEEVSKRGLKGVVRVSASGCMDLCERGPSVLVFTEKGERIVYTGVSESDVAAIADKHIRK